MSLTNERKGTFENMYKLILFELCISWILVIFSLLQLKFKLTTTSSPLWCFMEKILYL